MRLTAQDTCSRQYCRDLERLDLNVVTKYRMEHPLRLQYIEVQVGGVDSCWNRPLRFESRHAPANLPCFPVPTLDCENAKELSKTLSEDTLLTMVGYALHCIIN